MAERQRQSSGHASTRSRSSSAPVKVLEEFNLDIAPGEFLVLLGASGSGKTTALRILSGLETASGGRVLIGDRDVTNVLPKYRDISMVFQSYALYPHKTVAENIGFPLKVRKVRKADMDAAIREAAAQVQLDRASRPLSAPALGRPTATRGAGPRHHSPAIGLPDGRAAVQSRCQVAGPHARRAQAHAADARHHHHLCHPRPDRGDDAGASRGDPGERHLCSSSHRPPRSTTIPPICSSPSSSARRR